MTQDYGYLLVEEPDTPARQVELRPPGLDIGSHPQSRLRLSDPAVEPRHAQLRIEANGALLLSRATATLVSGTALPPLQSRPILSGEVIQIGNCLITYVGPGQTPPDVKRSVKPVAPPDGSKPWAGRLRVPRAEDEAPRAPLGPSSYLRYLPGIFQEHEVSGVTYPDDESHTFLGRYLLIFESIWELLEQRQDNIDLYFHPAASPDRFVDWLGSWVGIAVEAGWPEARRRNLVAEAFELYRWRGTRYGLQRLIEVATGERPTIDDALEPDEPGAPQRSTFRVIMKQPTDGSFSREQIVALIEAHKPAHAGFTLELQP